MEKIILSFLLATSLLSLGSCVDSKLPKYIELSGLRILTLVASTPEVDAGSTVTITPVISDINETTSITYEAYGCIDPGVALGAKPTCDGNQTKTLLSQGTITSASNSEMAQNFTGNAPSFTATIPANAVIFSQRSSIDQYNGVSYLVTYKITNSSGQSVDSFKRVIVSIKTASDKNTNPVVNNILSQGSALASNAFPISGKFTLQMDLGTNAAQTYPFKKADESIENRSEEITTTWFITDGSLKYFRSANQDTNEFTAPDSLPITRKSFLFSVSRDSRGGVTVKRICGGC
jgi:hypothetical protein